MIAKAKLYTILVPCWVTTWCQNPEAKPVENHWTEDKSAGWDVEGNERRQKEKWKV